MSTIDPFSAEGAKRIAQIAGQQPAPVSANVLTQPALPSLPQPAQTPAPVFPAIPSLENIFSSQPSRLEGEFETASRNVGELQGKLAEETAFRAQQEQAFGVQGFRSQLTDITSQLTTLQNEANAGKINAEGRPIAMGLITGEQEKIERQRTIKALGLSAIAQAIQGNIATALDQVESAVKATFEPLKAQLAAQKAQLEAITPLLDREDKKRAAEQQAALAERERLLAQQEADRKAVGQVMLKAAEYGADAVTLQKIQNTSTLEAAIAAAGSSLRDPRAVLELESIRLDQELARAQIQRVRTETAQIGQPSAKDRQEQDKAVQAAKEAIPVAQDKITLINSLINHAGLNSAVGTAWAGRIGIADKVSGAKQDFIGGVQQLVNRDTLDTLINLKAQGGTLGALSDQERIMLQSAASKIGSWQIVDKTGKTTGYNIDQGSFKRELETIRTLAQRALDKAIGSASLLTIHERSAIQSFLSTTSASTPQTFNPASYFNQ